jgi:hypothetical protein
MAQTDRVKSIFDLPEYKPFRARWDTRRKELARRKSYYDGSIYTDVRRKLGWLAPRLYRGIKPLYLPLSRAVDVDAGIIPGGWTLPEDEPRRDAWQVAIDTIFDWSDWDIDGVLYVHYGAMYGVTALKMADLRDQKRVIVKPINPACVLLVETMEYDLTPTLAFWAETRADKKTGEEFEYAEVVTSETIRTFANGKPAKFDGREPEYANELKFVPFVEVDHIRTGEALGEATYQKAMPLLDEVNELASYLADIIRKHAEPQWAISGAEPGELTKSGDNVWFLPGDSKATPMVAGIDIPGVLDFIREIRDQVHGALPELAFTALLEKTQIATATLELQLMELVLKTKRTRPNYDHGLADALRMAGRAAATMGLGDVAVLDDEGLRLDEKRPVLPLDPETANRLEMQALALERERALAGPGEGAGGQGSGGDA